MLNTSIYFLKICCMFESGAFFLKMFLFFDLHAE